MNSPMTSTLACHTARTLALVVILLCCVLAGSTFAQSTGDPRILPPNAHPYGQTYGEWSAAHWQWLYSLPVDAHPLFDTADCSTGQSGRVWFLGGTFTTVDAGPGVVKGIATRDCTVPAGTALFFPIIDGECATAEGNGTTDAELRVCAKAQIDPVDPARDLSCDIDGVAVQNLAAFRVQSPLFTWGPLPENNVFQDPDNFPTGTTSDSVSDGYFVMVAPLSAGTHTIHFTGSVVIPDLTFMLDITYHLTVE